MSGAAVALAAEIAEQPDAVARVLAGQADPVAAMARRWRHRGDVDVVLLAARGTSDNVARYAQYALGARNHLVVALAAPSLFTRYGTPPRLDRALVGAISQSGRSPDVVGVLAEARRQGRPTLAITNDPASPLAGSADDVVDLRAGDERSVAATKTYTTSLAAVALLSLGLDPDPVAAAELDAVPVALRRAIDAATAAVTIPDWLRDAPACAVIGRGFNYATAFEVALKLKELTGIAAEPYSSADFLHGPVAAVHWQMPVVLVAPAGAVHDDVVGLIDRLADRGARLVVVSDDDEALARADLPLPLPTGGAEWVSPLVAVVPGQVLAWRLAEARGLDVDQPTGLRKVTETR